MRFLSRTLLLAPVLGKQEAYEKGCHEAWMIENGYVTEGTSSNAYIVKDGKVITRGLSNEILAVCTRRALFRLAREGARSTAARPPTGHAGELLDRQRRSEVCRGSGGGDAQRQDQPERIRLLFEYLVLRAGL
ncbi:MAG: aminotransferase class IV [Acidobacteria bacterium]|nr:aminotransferase class IV [Acidobacteriota bacterium]